MKRNLIIFAILLIIMITVTGCSKDKILDIYDRSIKSLGNIQLTRERLLKGEKIKGKDEYTGSYLAKYEDFTGIEYLFGGTTIEGDQANKLSCDLKIKEGLASLVFISGSGTPEILINKTGSWVGTIEIPAGSNYLYFEAENFDGYLKLNID